MTAKLGRLPELGVIDRRSAAQYRRTTKLPKQIGSELGVTYLVEGMVRWARDRTGTWRAQVTSTLVDARAGTTKWSAEPMVITPDDPFSAQSAIATKVAEALQVALRPADRAGLMRRTTDNPQAFAAYQRGSALYNFYSSSPNALRRAIEEFKYAVTLDSSFADAWSRLASATTQLAIFSPGDRVIDSLMHATISLALVHASDHPLLLEAIAYKKLFFDRDTVGVDALVSRALASAPNDAAVLSATSAHLFFRQQRYDSAYTLARRAAALDPRSRETLTGAANIAIGVRRWDEARRYTDALLALDSADELGWSTRMVSPTMQGDTLALQRELNQLKIRLPHASYRVRTTMAYAGTPSAARFVALSARELGIATLVDSVTRYYDIKADAFIRLGDTTRARIQYDSIRTLLTGRPLSGFFEGQLLSYLALAQAVAGQREAARRTLDRSLAAARSSSARPDLSDVLASDLIAGIHARLGEPDAAVRWLEMAVANPGGGWTARGFANRPKLFLLRGTSAYEQFLSKHP